MAPLAPGSQAPPVPGVDFAAGPTVLFFYKVTCPVCQLAAPAAERFQRTYPGRIVGVGEDPEEKLDAFASEYGLSFPSVSDPPPYETSEAYGLVAVPTTFLLDDGTIAETVESWDREGLNRLSRRLAGFTGAPYAPISEEGDGLPAFRPG